MSNVTPLHGDPTAPFQDVIDAIREYGPHRMVIILDGGEGDAVHTMGFEDDAEVKQVLYHWYEQYLIDEMLERVE